MFSVVHGVLCKEVEEQEQQLQPGGTHQGVMQFSWLYKNATSSTSFVAGGLLLPLLLVLRRRIHLGGKNPDAAAAASLNT